jgi:hypothetical protein
MKYTVLATADAEKRLADVWLSARDRAGVTAAANAIDRSLGRDPAGQGESRAGSVRILFARPLVAEFEVVEPDRAVYILSVWSIARGDAGRTIGR